MAAAGYTSVEEIPDIVSRLRETYLSGKTRDVEWRKDQLKNLAYLVQDNEAEICESIRKDIGRSKNETYMAEIGGLVNEIIGAIHRVDQWAKPEKPKVDFEWKVSNPIIYKQPKGVALIIGTWNYQVSLSLGPLVGAIAAGCPAVVKCSEVVSNSSGLLAKLIPKYMDTSAYAVVQGEVDVVSKLLEYQWGQVFYTGNSKVARIISVAAGKTLSPVTLELGGKGPCIIDPELSGSKLETAVKRILWAKRVNCGQTCIAPDFVIVPKEKQQAFLAVVKRQHDKIFPRASLAEDDYPRIVSQNHYDRLNGALEKTKGDVVIKGQTDRSQRMMGMSVVQDVTWEDELMKDEIFGPILPIVPVASIPAAVEKLKGGTPLSLSIFSDSRKFIESVRESTNSGSVVVNDLMVQFTVDGLPFGGTGESGQGGYHGKRSFDLFTHERSSLHTPFWADFLMAVRYYPYTDANNKVFRSFMIKKIDFARPGTQASLFGVGGIGWKLLKYAFIAAIVGLIGSRWSWMYSLIPKYKLVRVQ